MIDTFSVESGISDSYRHWSRESQPYATGDVLIHYLRTGWTVSDVVTVEPYYFAEDRRVHVFRFTLTHYDQTLTMPVIANPRIGRLLKEYGIVPVMAQSGGPGQFAGTGDPSPFPAT